MVRYKHVKRKEKKTCPHLHRGTRVGSQKHHIPHSLPLGERQPDVGSGHPFICGDPLAQLRSSQQDGLYVARPVSQVTCPHQAASTRGRHTHTARLNSCLLHVHLKRLLRLNTSYGISTKGQHQVDSVCFMHVSMWPRLYPPVSERFGGSQSPSLPCVFLFRASLVTSGQPAGEGRGCREFTVRLCPQERRVP